MNQVFQIESLSVAQRSALKYQTQDFADTTFLALSEKIAIDYGTVLRDAVVAKLTEKGNLKLREIKILAGIFFYKGNVTPALIADMLRYDPATVSRALKTLKTVDMIETGVSLTDLRSITLHLTPKGQRLAQAYIDQVRATFADMETYLSHGLTDEEKLAYLDIMVKISRRAATMRHVVGLKSG